MFTISKEFSFDAAYSLHYLPKDHPCTRLHGHTYTVIVELWSKGLNEAGFVKDYRELDEFKQWINDKLDHRNLNEVLPIRNPSAELIAKFIFDTWKHKLRELHAITIKETPKTAARYEQATD